MIDYRCFALEQANSKNGPEWKAWEQTGDYLSRGLIPLRGGVAAARQGSQAHHDYVMAVLDAKHLRREDIRSVEAVGECARQSGLDMTKFMADMEDPSTLEAVGRDHEFAVEHGVFGTPTFRFVDGSWAFLKVFTPPEAETMKAFDHFMGIASESKYFGELKRPQPPWPRGATE